jgi:hypothetical protein
MKTRWLYCTNSAEALLFVKAGQMGGGGQMLQKLGPYISEAWQSAADAENRASSADSSELRVEYDRLAKSWRRLARSFEFAQTLERFILDRDKAGEAPPEPPSDD